MKGVAVPPGGERPRGPRHGARTLTVVHEVDRVDLDLHDLVVQRLFAAGLQLSGALGLLVEDPQRAAAQIGAAVEELEAAVRHVRSSAFCAPLPPELPTAPAGRGAAEGRPAPRR